MAKQVIIFTDLDGSLLDKETFNFDLIKNYINELISSGIIIIPNSSKTKAELLNFNKENNLNLCFISENGSNIHGLNLLNDKLPINISLSRSKNDIYKIFDKSLSHNFKQKITFILDLNIEDQAKILGLPLDKIILAMERKHSIPILFSGNEIEKNKFIKNIEDIGLSVQTGGRIMNICDNVNKSKAMLKTLELISKKIDDDIITIGVGDNHNDIEMLKNTNYPCLVKNSNFDSSLINIDNLIRSNEPSPKGWADVIKTALQKI